MELVVCNYCETKSKVSYDTDTCPQCNTNGWLKDYKGEYNV